VVNWILFGCFSVHPKTRSEPLFFSDELRVLLYISDSYILCFVSFEFLVRTSMLHEVGSKERGVLDEHFYARSIYMYSLIRRKRD
jgi:hypothetical protein